MTDEHTCTLTRQPPPVCSIMSERKKYVYSFWMARVEIRDRFSFLLQNSFRLLHILVFIIFLPSVSPSVTLIQRTNDVFSAASSSVFIHISSLCI